LFTLLILDPPEAGVLVESAIALLPRVLVTAHLVANGLSSPTPVVGVVPSVFLAYLARAVGRLDVGVRSIDALFPPCLVAARFNATPLR
jgi:hypothetical protein